MAEEDLKFAISTLVNSNLDLVSEVGTLRKEISVLREEITESRTQEPEIYYNNFKYCIPTDPEDFRIYNESSIFSEHPLSMSNIVVTCSKYFESSLNFFFPGANKEGLVGVVSNDLYLSGEGTWCKPWGSLAEQCIGASQLEPYEG